MNTDSKWDAFTRFVGDVGDRTHEYARKFTVINTEIGLPVALQSFRERISRLGNDEINGHLITFFQTFFTKERLIDYVTQEILTKNSETADGSGDEIAKNPFSYQNVRTLLWGLSGQSADPSKDPVAYFKTLAGILEDDQDEWDYETTPLSPGEIEALLQAIGCLKRH